MTRYTFLYFVLFIYTLLIIFVSVIPMNQNMPVQNGDKVGHFLAYTGLALLVCLAFPKRNEQIVALVLALGLGFSLEWIQSFIPGRDMSAWDGLANSLGILTGIILYQFQGQTFKRWLRL